MRTRLAAAALAAAALLSLTACSSSDDDDKAEPPAYTVTRQDASGNQRTITVQVSSTTGLRAIFDDVIDNKAGDNAGYFVEINCSTGATKGADNRLANGRYAKGNIGAATTGLADGKSEFSAVAGAQCPDKG
jgi:type IV pilus biogenesis protein CpaD/CtpE